MKPLILLVDDNDDILTFLESELCTHYRIKKALDGCEALEVLQEEAVQLVVSDIMMDGMDGLQLCKRMKAHADYRHMPLILLTAKNTHQSKIEGLETGADAYVEKPFSPDFLRVQIANLLENRTRIKEHFAHSPLLHIQTPGFSKTEEHFMEKLHEEILLHMEETGLGVEDLARYMNMSRPTLYRTIKSITGISPSDLINITRLKKAAELLAEGSYKIYEVADLTGFASQTYFGRSFLKQFGITPSEYIATKKTNPILKAG
ncbi:Helix-turn-helix domain-containing protein [Filimonas lacunae]|uniref:Helix-turn-helix domain-containing protein n=1 Tax=Filimonas lacunae TaxID=477680 RepID=A0A173MI79_9BACT|nr:response regulator [Filimonas lacunae]BAV07118.1 DNA-binding response regulator, AraC family [Filimonas lacunae]SIS94776.1 Helix-turn-helix domain-containing protein [Filimonas lacunae]